jgi:hypothetical protein
MIALSKKQTRMPPRRYFAIPPMKQGRVKREGGKARQIEGKYVWGYTLD